ncbi:hypothetical protein H7683_02135 [Ectopseudomonas mendocina]|jgi:hypothetical protein|uniref:Uncharacterized protein n=1 Tax=Ectopseudomonas mendocina TaxID=300 RepID=A0A379ISM4_ECTME|nr:MULTISPECIES: hypothetical protein [Pseudomonas]MDF2077506.1 hypothetical protein [Pseudomonas mendocina]QTN46451.1 hypothetical protein H7683_02135 [Pseudomonas mendocina]TRO31388.1 hypothetical protein EQ832_25015 [Pseudomonas sp. ALS1131]SUD39204.1 Uncharacterised protein [Pseudomonas mendocina]
MTSINNSIPAMLSYYGSQANNRSSIASGETDSQASQDPLGDLRRFAKQVVARSEGGLLRAMNGGSAPASNAVQRSAGNQAAAPSVIQLPDVTQLDRDDAAKLLQQVQKMVDAGLDGSVRIAGHNGDKQTDSLETYRQWLQEKGGLSVYA